LLYQRCAAFVSLTSYEELGLPLLEAMYCGAPIVAGRSAPQMEVVGDAGLLFDVANAGELARCLAHVLGDSSRARQLSEQAVIRARCFGMDGTAQRVLDVLPQLHPANPLRAG
jgi:glycosyltransferase involved in cell wall biosynthesis